MTLAFKQSSNGFEKQATKDAKTQRYHSRKILNILYSVKQSVQPRLFSAIVYSENEVFKTSLN